MFRGSFGAALVLGLLSIMAGSASAAGWLAPVNVSETMPTADKYAASLQDIALDGDGDAVAVWVPAEGSGPEVVRAATRPAGGGWSNFVAISPVGEGPLALKVVAAPDGDAAAIWVGVKPGARQVVRVATLVAGADWSEPAVLSDVDGFASEPDVAIDTQGNLTAIWSEGAVNSFGVVHAASRPAGGDWSEPVTLSDGLATEPQVAVDPQGDVTALWTLLDGNRDDGTIQSKTRPVGGGWDADAVDVSGEGGLAGHPRVAFDAQGAATAVWQRRDIPDYSGYKLFVQSAGRTAGTWSAPLTISNAGDFAGSPELAVDPQGEATAIWSGFGEVARFVQVSSRPAEGSWGSPVDLVTKSGGLEPSEGDLQVAADSEGNVTTIWTAWAAPNLVVRSARRPAGGAWGAPTEVSAPASYSLWPRLAVDLQGDATVVWSGFQGGAQAVRSRLFDQVAPELRDVTIPASAIAGQPVAMSVEPFDILSPVAISWDFGDGSSGSGHAVSHCYSSPGERTVTVAGTDAAANTASSSRTISIAPAPSLGPGSDPCGGPGPPDDPAQHADPGPVDPGPPGPGAGPDLGRAAPVVSALRQSRSRWRSHRGRGGSRLPVGTTFRFRLDRPARVRLAFTRIFPARRDRSCGAVEIVGKAGANAYGFRGKVGRHLLKPGRYRMRVTALADGKHSAVATIRFTIAR